MTIDDLKGRTCIGGLDLAKSVDLNAFVLFFPADENFPKHAILPFFGFQKKKQKIIPIGWTT